MKDGRIGGLVTLFSAKNKPLVVPSKIAPPKELSNRDDWTMFKEEPLEYWYLYLIVFLIIMALICVMIYCCCYGPEVDGTGGNDPLKAKEE